MSVWIVLFRLLYLASFSVSFVFFIVEGVV